MSSRVGITLVICLLGVSSAAGQVVRFETSVGDFDMVLNPTNDPLLQEHVDNMLRYVEDNRYRGVWINRAGKDVAGNDFVLQLGGFYSHTRRPPPTIDSVRPVASFAPTTGVPAAITGLSNTVGTVSLALSGSNNVTNQDSGTSSFFINVADNSGLDSDFTVFAAISDLTVVNQIMDLMSVDRTTDPNFGVGSGNLAFSDVPLQDNGQQVFVHRAFVIEDVMAATMARSAVQATMAQSASAFAAGSGGSGNGSSAPLLPSTAVPEPSGFVLALFGALGLRLLARRRRR